MELKGKGVLIIDDDDFIKKLIARLLQSESLFENYFFAADGMEGFKLLKSKRKEIDLVFCDLNMPLFDGFKFLQLKGRDDSLFDIPVIILTGAEEKDLKLRGLNEGANDYLTKPADPQEIIARTRVQLKIKLLQDELKRKNKILEELSHTDTLTHIFNRRYFMEMMEREFARSMRYGRPLSFAIIDIDHFKDINDTYGHQVGDTVLIEFVSLIKSGLRKHDIIGRYGGEEFTILLPETPLENGIKVLERHRRNIESKKFAGELGIKVTFSGGITGIPDANISSVDEMIKCADQALYRAKREGRNRISTFNELQKIS